MFETVFGVGRTGDAYLNISVGGFSCVSLNQSVGYGNTFDLNSAIPNNYLQTDFKRHNKEI